MVEVFLAVLPVFMILGVGMVLDRIHLLPEAFAGQLSQYVLKVAMPCLLLRMVSGAELSLSSMGGFLLGLFVAQCALFVLVYAGLSGGFRKSGPEPIIIALIGACSNSGFLGLPIIDSLLPGNHEAMVAGGLSCIMPPLALICAQSLLETQNRADGSRSVPRIVARAVLLNPFFVATVLGMAVSFSGVKLWAPADRVMALIGSTGAPCALIALGLDMWRKMAVARRSTNPKRLTWQGCVVLVKLVLHPLLAWGLLALCGVSGVWLGVGVLMSGTSTAVMAYVLAEVKGVIPEECALSVEVTAFLSMFTIPVFALALRAAGYL